MNTVAEVVIAVALQVSSLAPGFQCAGVAAIQEKVDELGRPSVIHTDTYAEYYWRDGLNDDLAVLIVWVEDGVCSSQFFIEQAPADPSLSTIW